MAIWNLFKRSPKKKEVRHEPAVRATVSAPSGGGETFYGMDDPCFLAYMRRGEAGGQDLIGERRLRNMALLRCATLISESVGMLPINLLATDSTKAVQSGNQAHRLIKLKPNGWQTPHEFKSLIQLHALLDGNGYGRIIRSPLGNRPVAIVPCRRFSTRPRLTESFEVVYDHVDPFGNSIELKADEVLHLRDVSLDGIHGISRLRLGRNALDLAEAAERSTEKLFRTGVMAGGALESKDALSDQAYGRLKESLHDDYGGAENAGNWMILEEGLTAKQFATTAQSSQQIENRNHQIEEVARMYGVPRPLLMMDDTSWGSGVEQLALFFIQYGLSHWFVQWEQALARCFLSDKELGAYAFKFNEAALLRGTLNDQAAFFSKALGAGGSSPWMTQNEVRDTLDMPRNNDAVADQLRNPMTQKTKGDAKQ
ncbi:phage portal protein [Burkholderia ubonensis]|uniref:phage portal protein n=1 Tax=Burkholderia ubonensis TaxID=101571 RepID=UPI0007570640|nr:phage portal protein [Burkholderia ubonensis]KVW30735.1 portal protein [Burkholderia ubonensis]